MTNNRHKFRKKSHQVVVAVQLRLDTEGFTYIKWDGTQKCKQNDWLVNNNNDFYTIDNEEFEETYSSVGQGQYAKTKPVWAEVAESAGTVKTLEGSSAYNLGDYLISKTEDGPIAYPVTPDKFKSMYERAD